MKKTTFYLIIALASVICGTGCKSTKQSTSHGKQHNHVQSAQAQVGQTRNVNYRQRPVVQQQPQTRYIFVTPGDSGKVQLSNTIPVVKPYIPAPEGYYHQHVFDRVAGYSTSSELIRQCRCGRNYPNVPAISFGAPPMNYRYVPAR